MCNQRRSLGPERYLSEVGTPPTHDFDTPHILVARNTTQYNITTRIIFHLPVASFPATQGRNEVEVPGRECEMVCDASVLKTLQKHIGRQDCVAQAVHCALISLQHMCNLTHTKASERIKFVIYDVDKYSGYWFMKIIWFNNIFSVSPMAMITGSISNGDIVDPKPVNSRTKETVPQMLTLENIDLLMLLALI